MRIAILCCLALLAACRAPYMHEYANVTALGADLPAVGTGEAALIEWFDANDYAPARRVWQSEAELRRPPGTAWVHAEDSERAWWMTRVQTLRHFCVTQKFIYYRLDDNGALSQAIMAPRSQC